jgi:hypothetical protein
MNKDEEILKELEGRILSSIEFVSTYYQLRFDGPQLNVINYPEIIVDKRDSFSHDEKEFCYYLLKCIGKTVEEVRFENDSFFEIHFQNRLVFYVSMKPENYQVGSEEALLYWNAKGNLVVW